MSLPNPLPDNPQRWEGWRNYTSPDPYARLCLSFDANPTNEQIEENCRLLLVWWQKKLPLKNQPSNPVAQMLRAGLDDAPVHLAEAKTRLLNPETRAEIDREVRERIVQEAGAEFKKIIPFAINGTQLLPEGEERLYDGGAKLGLSREEMRAIVDAELQRLGVVRVEAPAPVVAPVPVPSTGGVENSRGTPAEEFRRVLKLSKLCLDGEELTDDQRDALCNMGESLGLTGGEAEDLIDEYLEEAVLLPASGPAQPARPMRGMPVAPVKPVFKPAPAPVKAAPKEPPVIINVSPMARLQEKQKHPNFTNKYGLEMMLVTSGQFLMGSEAPEAAPNEQPTAATTLRCFYMSRFPVTNAQFEQFDPAHTIRRPAWANDLHPVVYVTPKEAIAFCQWLTARHGHLYRLPSEAEWEYAARGTDGRVYPWGARLDAGHYANFADKRTNFPWSDRNLDDGFAESAPVGTYPRGASPFGMEDMAGNVFEWCSDYFDIYRGSNRVNPHGPTNGTKRIYRGGSWKSRAASLRTSARSFNMDNYSSNDVGFRVVCECEAD